MRLYLHIPFCRQKCTYCKFALTPFVREAQIARYLSALRTEIRAFFEDSKNTWLIKHSSSFLKTTIESIYFGGGTPSVLSVQQVAEILNEIQSSAQMQEGAEISFECNPEDITPEYARGLYKLGINRISLGVQTLSDETLKYIGRGGSRDITKNALAILFDAGFSNINVDYILGLPKVLAGETLTGIRTLHETFPKITHTSVYFLEKGDYPKAWKNESFDEVGMIEEYTKIRSYLQEERGFHHYEISNFALPGFESRHNLGYWKRENGRGFGLSAASLVDGVRTENAPSFAGYYRGDREMEVLDVEAVRIERVLCGLRTFSADISVFHDGVSLNRWIDSGHLLQEGGKIFPTLTWIFILDRIMGELV